MGNAHQQLLPLQPMDRLAQRPAADAIGTRQLGLGDLAARRHLAAHDGQLDLAEDVFSQGSGIFPGFDTFGSFQHIVDTNIDLSSDKSISTKISSHFVDNMRPDWLFKPCR